jgi:hypothetical protein
MSCSPDCTLKACDAKENNKMAGVKRIFKDSRDEVRNKAPVGPTYCCRPQNWWGSIEREQSLGEKDVWLALRNEKWGDFLTRYSKRGLVAEFVELKLHLTILHLQVTSAGHS